MNSHVTSTLCPWMATVVLPSPCACCAYPVAPQVKVALWPVKPAAHDTVQVEPAAVLAHCAVVAPAMTGAAQVTAVVKEDVLGVFVNFGARGGG